MTAPGPAALERATADDVVSLATDVGPAPMQVGAVVVLDTTERAVDIDGAVRAIGERIRAVPRLRQRLVDAPLGGGRPVWVDDERFDLAAHVDVVPWPEPGDEQALLDLAAASIARPLPRARPLWRMTVVDGREAGRVALVVAFHHVLADGIGGLAVLATLVDGVGAPPDPPFPRRAPSPHELRADRVRSLLRSALHLGDALRRVAGAARELKPGQAPFAGRCSLNRPTDGDRRLRVVRVDLDEVRDVAHAQGVTVNDVLLAAVAASLGGLLERRGEHLDEIVASMPVSARRSASATSLGNEVGAVPVRLPTHGSLEDRLRATGEVTRAAKANPPGSTSALLGPLFRLLAALGRFRWFIGHQRLVHTFATNLRGPEEPLTMFGAPVTSVLPVALVPGNVTVSFAALSYVGTLAVIVIADPDTCPDLDVLSGLLTDHLAGVAGH